MPITPLQLPDPIRQPQIDWSPLSQLGDTIAAARRKQRIGEIVAQAGGDTGAMATALSREGLLDEARPLFALAHQKAALDQTVSHQKAVLAQSAAAQAESARHNRAVEGIQAEALKSKPEITWQENDAGQKVPYLVDPRKGALAPIPVPGLTDQPAANPYAVGGKMTENQSKDAGYAERMFQAEQVLSDPAVVSAAQSRVQRGYAGTPYIGNSLVSPEYQKYDQAQRNFINAILRRESGAAISQSEFDNANLQYFPQPGDSPEKLALKAQNRRTAIEGIASGAGKAYRPKLIFDEGGKLVPNRAGKNVSAPPVQSVAPTAPSVGATATNPKTGQRIRWNGQMWEPI